jgi:exodeoxyribonuclease V gamma subunit
VRERVVVHHPLQPFDLRNVTPGGLVPNQPFTFDPTALVAAEAVVGDRQATRAFFAHPLPEPPHHDVADVADVALADLVTFFKDPVRGFFRALDYALPWEVEELDDEMPVEIDSLQEWTVGDRMLRDMLRGMHPETAAHAEWRRGTLPPGRLGMRKAKHIRDQAADLARAALQQRRPGPDAFDVDVDLGRDFGGRRLTGTVSPVYGERTVSVTYSRLGGRHLMESWIPLLALSDAVPGRDWTALCIGRAKDDDHIEQRLLGPPPDPAETVRDLVRLYDAGRREPLPLPVRTSFAWAEARHRGGDPVKAAGWRWHSGDRFRGENAEPAHERVWGKTAPLTVLLGAAHPGEGADGEDTRLGALAARLWLPLLRAEVR